MSNGVCRNVSPQQMLDRTRRKVKTVGAGWRGCGRVGSGAPGASVTRRSMVNGAVTVSGGYRGWRHDA